MDSCDKETVIKQSHPQSGGFESSDRFFIPEKLRYKIKLHHTQRVDIIKIYLRKLKVLFYPVGYGSTFILSLYYTLNLLTHTRIPHPFSLRYQMPD